MPTPELQPTIESTAEQNPDQNLEQYERLEKGLENKEKTVESGEKHAERARVEALEKAVSVEKAGAEKDKKPAQSSPARRRGPMNKKEKKASFDKHMKQIQAEMNPAQRTFSKFIHNPAIEKASEAVGATIARPNAILTGSVVAFVLVLGVYVLARVLGYALSGFETIAAFAVGWIIGLLYDYFRVMITGKKD